MGWENSDWICRQGGGGGDEDGRHAAEAGPLRLHRDGVLLSLPSVALNICHVPLANKHVMDT